MQALAFFVDEFCNYPSRVGTFQQFYLGFALPEKSGIYPLTLYHFCLVTLAVQQFFKQRNRYCQAFYCDADMFGFQHFFGFIAGVYEIGK